MATIVCWRILAPICAAITAFLFAPGPTMGQNAGTLNPTAVHSPVVIDSENHSTASRSLDSARKATKSPELLLYAAEINQRLTSRWRPAHDMQGKVSVSCSIDRKGTVSKVFVAHGCGDDTNDREALALIQQSSPFPPLPLSAPPEITITVELNCYRRADAGPPGVLAAGLGSVPVLAGQGSIKDLGDGPYYSYTGLIMWTRTQGLIDLKSGETRIVKRNAPAGPAGIHCPNCLDYAKTIAGKVAVEWNDRKNTAATGAYAVTFRVDSKGGISDAKIVHGSGEDKTDQELLGAVLAAAPFTPPPSDWPADHEYCLNFFAPNEQQQQQQQQQQQPAATSNP